MEHYRNFKCYIPETGGERVSNTMEIFPRHVEMPFRNPSEALMSVLQYLVETLKQPYPNPSLIPPGDVTVAAINQLALLFNQPTPPEAPQYKKPNPEPQPKVPPLGPEALPRVPGPQLPRVETPSPQDTPIDCRILDPDIPLRRSRRLLKLS